MQLQALVAEFNQSHQKSIGRSARVLDLASEVGEVCKLAFSEDMGGFVSLEKWEEELGDSLYSLLSLMCEQKIDAEQALLNVIKKYQSRILKQGSMSSSRGT